MNFGIFWVPELKRWSLQWHWLWCVRHPQIWSDFFWNIKQFVLALIWKPHRYRQVHSEVIINFMVLAKFTSGPCPFELIQILKMCQNSTKIKTGISPWMLQIDVVVSSNPERLNYFCALTHKLQQTYSYSLKWNLLLTNGPHLTEQYLCILLFFFKKRAHD